jgi:hypothetical protein
MKMETKRDDGGPAYPTPVQDDRDCAGRVLNGYGGLTMRDWFAGQALIGIMAHDPMENAYVMTSDCYMIADAMLKARAE